MATFQAELPPIHNLGTPEEEILRIKRYLVRLAEQLDYTLNNLDLGGSTDGSYESTASGVNPGSYGDTGDQTPGFGETFRALWATVNAAGKVTSMSAHDVTMPNAAASASAAGLMSAADKAKLDQIPAGAEANVQADWNETDPTSDAYINNKPTIPPGSVVDSALSTTSENPVQNKVITAALFQQRGEEDADLDNCTDPGVYDYLSTATHTPVSGAGGTLIVTPGPGGYVMQISIPRDGGGDSRLYVRQYTSSLVWGAWQELALAAEVPAAPEAGNVELTATDASVATIGGLRLYKYGDVRVLMGYITAVNLTTTLTTVTTIPAGHRPVAGAPIRIYSTVTALASSVGIVNAGGTVQVRLASARTSGNIYLNASWIVS